MVYQVLVTNDIIPLQYSLVIASLIKLMRRSDRLRDVITIYHIMSEKSSKSHFLNMISDIDNVPEE